MGDLFFYVAAFVFVIALIVLGAWLWRSMLERGVSVPGNTLFKGARDKRIGAIETANIDSRRKLVLIRRDNVEHLIMTGGPVDMVIEIGINSQQQPYQTQVQAQQTMQQNEQLYTGASPSLEERLYGPGGSETKSPFVADD